MKCTKYITVDCDGKNARLTTKPVRVEPWELCFPLEINIPDSYFQRPLLSARVSFEDCERLVTEVDAVGVKEAIKEATGVTLKIEIEHPEIDERPV